MIIFVVFLLGAITVWFVRRTINKRSLEQVFSARLSNDQRAIVRDQVPITQRLPWELHQRLEGKINGFLHQVEFHGCNGLEITEEMRLSIAAQACLLVVNTDQWYKNLRTILVYPDAFKSREKNSDGYIVSEREVVRLGESWARGPVILSWAHSQQGAEDDKDGHNVVIHEFAHQLDDLSGRTDGVPVLESGQPYSEWEAAFLHAYDSHIKNVESGRKTVIDAYGAQGHEEFFAVSVEVFFEKPGQLKHEVPKIYKQLAILFQLDPVSWDSADD